MNKKGILFCVLSAVLFGVAPLITKYIYTYHVDAIGLGFYRGLFALPFLYTMARRQNPSVRVKKTDFKKIVIVGFIGSTLTTLFLNLAYAYIDIGTACTLHFMHPMFVTLICVVFYKQVFTKDKVISLILAMAGIALFIDFNHLNNLQGITFAIVSSITYAFYFVTVDKFGLKKLDTFVLSFWTACVVTVGFFIMSLFSKSLFIPNSFGLTFLLFANAMVCQILAVTLLQVGIKYLGPQSASLLSLFEPITSLISGVLFLHEELSLFKLLGCCVIFTAVTIHILGDKPKDKNA